MAAIGKIRKHYGLVIIVIGIAMFAFILMDVLQDNASAFRGGSPDKIGEIDGEKVSFGEYDMHLQRSIENYRMQNERASLSEEEMHQVNEQTWNQLVTERIMIDEYKSLGITVTSEEIMELVTGDDPHQGIRSAFTNPETGQFDREAVHNFLRNMRDNPEAYRSWLSFEKSLLEERQRRKYYDLLKRSSFVTSIEGKNEYLTRNVNANIQYVALNLTDIPDEEISFSDRDLRRYYRENRDDYKQEQSRTIEYVSWDIRPSFEDSANVIAALEARKDDFRAAENDSVFLRRHSQRPWDPTFYPRGSFEEDLEDRIFNAEVGEVFGPVQQQESYFLVKVTAFGEDTVSNFNASHILIRPKGNTVADSNEALATARDILRQIRAGANFEDMAREHSEDLSNAPDGGDLGWFREGMMVEPFEQAVKRMRRGEMTVVQTQFGAHVIRLDENPSRRTVQMAIVERAIAPTQRTFQTMYTQASNFLINAHDGESFRSTAAEMGLNRRTLENVQPFDRTFAGLQNARELVRWAYNSNQGDVSTIMEINQRYVIAYIANAQEEGHADFEAVRDQVEAAYINERKKDILEERIREANRNVGTLAEVAASFGKEVGTATNVSFANTIVPQLGDEPRVVGTTFGLQQNVISFPIRGNNGVYQLVVQNVVEPAMPENFQEQRRTLRTDLEARSQFQTLEALRERANVRDLRYKFY